MSVFDPALFAQQTFVGANATKFVPIPVDQYPAEISKYEIKAWEGKEDKTKGGLKAIFTWKLDDHEGKLAELTGRKDNLIRQEIMLDLTPEGMLDLGKGVNVRLGRLREAIGLNVDGMAWSFDMFVGRRGIVSVTHEMYKDEPQAKVDAVAAE